MGEKVSESTNKNRFPATSFVKAHIVRFTENKTMQEGGVETKTNTQRWLECKWCYQHTDNSCSGRVMSEELNWVLLWHQRLYHPGTADTVMRGGGFVRHQAGISYSLVNLEYAAGSRMFSTAPLTVPKEAPVWPAGGFCCCISFSSLCKGEVSGLCCWAVVLLEPPHLFLVEGPAVSLPGPKWPPLAAGTAARHR